MIRKKSNSIIAVILLLSIFCSKLCYDLIDNEIKCKEFNLSLAEDANRDKLAIEGFLYDVGRKGYGSYQSDRYDYEEHQRKFEKRREKIDTLKTIRTISSIVIMIIGLCSAFIVYKKREHSVSVEK